MYIAHNRFRIAAGREDDFERVWRERKSYLHEVAGFRTFRLLRGQPQEGETIFVSQSEWDSREAFSAWTNSEVFKKAHREGRSPPGTVLAHPDFEGYTVALNK